MKADSHLVRDADLDVDQIVRRPFSLSQGPSAQKR
jgi:hypothetical protein